MKQWTRAEIEQVLLTNDKAVERALVKLFQRQTPTEKAANDTVDRNGVGFGSFDAGYMADWARQVLQGHHLSVGQLKTLRKPIRSGKTTRIGKYAGQLVELATAKELRREAKLTKVPEPSAPAAQPPVVQLSEEQFQLGV